MRTFMIAFGNFIFRWRDTIFSIIMIAPFIWMALAAPPGLFGGLNEDLAITIAGLLVMTLGQSVRIITIGYAYIKRGGLNKQIYAETVVRRGMFAHVRNPMYLGNLLIVTGAVIGINIRWFFLALLLFYFIYACIILAEENFLSGKFGADYQNYLKTTPRLIPHQLNKWQESIADMDFTWRRVLKKEHSSIFLVYAGLIGFGAMKLIYRHGFSANSPELMLCWIALGALLAFQIVTEILTRTSRLEWDPNRP
jgi:protein-S-isoprenylcysteine O-methyltransferase Ste14